jgi:tRNA1Val (adenine37-N6)-methyltransferase
MSGETKDALGAFGLTIRQPVKGYRFSVDPLLLCSFAANDGVLTVADLGTGCGVIPLVMARRLPEARIAGVEFQAEMAELARRNVDENGLGERVSILETDVLHLREELAHASFDLVLANPPYRRRGTGRQSPLAGRDAGRHESTATVEDFLAAAKFLVRPEGKICFVFLAARLADFLAAAAVLRLTLLRLQFVHGAPDVEAKMFLCELTAGKKGELAVLPPLVLRDEERNYTPEALAMMEGRVPPGM